MPEFSLEDFTGGEDFKPLGNIDLSTRPRVKNADGSISTVRSMSFNEDGQEILVPTISDDGNVLSDEDAIDLYHRTGKNLGKFASPQEATSYAEKLHQNEVKKLDTFSLDDFTGQPEKQMAPPPPPGPSLQEQVHGLGIFNIGDNTFDPLGGLGEVLGLAKKPVDWAARTGARAMGMDVPDTATTGSLYRAAVAPEQATGAGGGWGSAALNIMTGGLSGGIESITNPQARAAVGSLAEKGTDLATDPMGLAFQAGKLPGVVHHGIQAMMGKGVLEQGAAFVDEVKKGGFTPKAVEHLVGLGTDSAFLALAGLSPKEKSAALKNPEVQQVLTEKGISLDPSDPNSPFLDANPTFETKADKAAAAKKAKKEGTQEIKLKPLPPEDVPSIPMVPELGPGEAALPNVWNGEVYRGEPTPEMVQRPGPGSTTALGEVPFFGAPEGVTVRAGEMTPPPEAPRLNKEIVGLIDRISKEQNRAGDNEERFAEAKKQVKELEQGKVDEEGTPLDEEISIPEEEIKPEEHLPIELKATVQEAVEGFKSNKTSIAELQERLGIPEDEARELFWKTKKALQTEKSEGFLPLETLDESTTLKESSGPSLTASADLNKYVSPETLQKVANNPHLAKLNRWIENVFPSAKGAANRVLFGEEADVAKNRYAGMEYDPSKQASRHTGKLKGSRGSIVEAPEKRGLINLNPWQIAKEIDYKVRSGQISIKDAPQAFGKRLIDILTHENSHVGKADTHGKVNKNTGTNLEMDPEGYFDPESAREQFAFNTSHEAVRNDPTRIEQMRGILSDVNAKDLKDMYKSILRDSNQMEAEILSGKMKMEAPPKVERKYTQTMAESEGPPKKTDRVMGKDEYYDEVMAPKKGSPEWLAQMQERLQKNERKQLERSMKNAQIAEAEKGIFEEGQPLERTKTKWEDTGKGYSEPKSTEKIGFEELGFRKPLTSNAESEIPSWAREGQRATEELNAKRSKGEVPFVERRQGEGTPSKGVNVEAGRRATDELSQKRKGLEPPPSLDLSKEPKKATAAQLGIFGKETGAVGGPKGLKNVGTAQPINLGGHATNTPQGKGLSVVKSPLLEKVWNEVKDISSASRVITVGGDVSSPFRQSWIQTLAHPAQSAKNLKNIFHGLSEKGYERLNKEVESNPHYAIAEKSKLAIKAEEEQYAGMKYLEKRIGKGALPLKVTERGYNIYLRKTRMESFARGMDVLEKKYGKGDVPEEASKALAEWINTSTGRGHFSPRMEGVATELNKYLFSPRLLKSRLDVFDPRFWNPESHWRKMYRASPEVAKMAATELARSVATMGSLVALAKAGGADVEGDPRSPDFGKIKIGNTSIDPWGGYQQYVRIAAQLASGKRKTQYGDIRNVTIGDLLSRFTRSKLAPLPGFLWTAKEGKNFVGERAPLNEFKTYWDSFGVMTVRDINEIWKQDPALATSLMVPIALGISTTTRDELPTSKEVNKEFRRLKVAPPMDMNTIEDPSKTTTDPKTGKVKTERRQLSQEEFEKVKEGTNKEIWSQIEAFVSSPSYKKLSDAEKTIALNKLSRSFGAYRRKRGKELLLQPPPKR